MNEKQMTICASAINLTDYFVHLAKYFEILTTFWGKDTFKKMHNVTLLISNIVRLPSKDSYTKLLENVKAIIKNQKYENLHIEFFDRCMYCSPVLNKVTIGNNLFKYLF